MSVFQPSVYSVFSQPAVARQNILPLLVAPLVVAPFVGAAGVAGSAYKYWTASPDGEPTEVPPEVYSPQLPAAQSFNVSPVALPGEPAAEGEAEPFYRQSWFLPAVVIGLSGIAALAIMFWPARKP
jgi:hypothetical protein